MFLLIRPESRSTYRKCSCQRVPRIPTRSLYFILIFTSVVYVWVCVFAIYLSCLGSERKCAIPHAYTVKHVLSGKVIQNLPIFYMFTLKYWTKYSIWIESELYCRLMCETLQPCSCSFCYAKVHNKYDFANFHMHMLNIYWQPDHRMRKCTIQTIFIIIILWVLLR